MTRGIFTHFIREEDAGMTSGRLDDELRRMSAIAGQIEPHCLMLFNESFAGTNEREGSEIGHQIVRALLDAQVKVFFVTHRLRASPSASTASTQPPPCSCEPNASPTGAGTTSSP